jgi:cytochrome c oxidase subunit 3
MPGTLAEEIVLQDTGGGGAPPARPDDDGGDRGGPGGKPRAPRRAYFTALSLGLTCILMFFMALTSAYIVRKGLGGDWQPVELPQILWFTTAVLLASSFTIERARRHLAGGDAAGYRRWWTLTTALGFVFLGGQYLAWLALRTQGVFLASNPSSSFFYVLTAAHGAHLLGGILALLVVGLRRWPGAAERQATAVDVACVYWHFMDGLWVFLFLLLYLGR